MNQMTSPYHVNAFADTIAQSIALEETTAQNFLTYSIAVIAVIFFAFAMWAGFVRIDEIASASGTVIPNGYIQSIQHLEGGIVRQIMVEEGQLVEKDQDLLRLDDTNANADLGQMRARQNALQLQAARLNSFANGDMQNTLDAKTLTGNEQAILASMEEARASQQNVLRDQIAQKQQELKALTSTKTTLAKNITLMAEETKMHESMAAQGYGSKLTAMTSERELNQMRGQLNETSSQMNQAQDGIRESENRLASLGADLKQEAMKKLGEIDAELAEINKALAKVESAASRTVIKAPVRGIIKGMTIHTLGAVIEPGKTLMDIVPVEEELMVEAMVLPSDIGNIDKGQDVNIKVSAFDFSRYGKVKGRVLNISGSTFQNQDGQSFYKAKVKLAQNFVGHDENNNLILPGMTVQADIVTGNKTLLQYLLKPINVVMQGAFHEH